MDSSPMPNSQATQSSAALRPRRRELVTGRLRGQAPVAWLLPADYRTATEVLASRRLGQIIMPLKYFTHKNLIFMINGVHGSKARCE